MELLNNKILFISLLIIISTFFSSSPSEDIIITELDSNIVSKEACRFVYGYKQGKMTSCGLTAIASLLTYYYDTAITENDIIKSFFKDKEANKDYMVSLQDLKEIATSFSFKTKAVKVDIEKLNKFITYAPIIIHFQKPSTHFTLLIGTYYNYYILADSGLGLYFMEREEFNNHWSGYCLFVYGQDNLKNKKNIDEAVRLCSEKIQYMVDISILN